MLYIHELSKQIEQIRRNPLPRRLRKGKTKKSSETLEAETNQRAPVETAKNPVSETKARVYQRRPQRKQEKVQEVEEPEHMEVERKESIQAGK